MTASSVKSLGRRLMSPPDTALYRVNRFTLGSTMPWETWLHAGTWVAMLVIVWTGERGVLPPIDGIDWYWLSFGFVSPLIGFFSAWTLAHKGKPRYYALWGRMIANAGLATTFLLYQLDRFLSNNQISDIGFGYGVLPNVILFLSMGFAINLVFRDIRFIVVTEKIASEIYRK